MSHVLKARIVFSHLPRRAEKGINVALILPANIQRATQRNKPLDSEQGRIGLITPKVIGRRDKAGRRREIIRLCFWLFKVMQRCLQ